MVDTLVLPTGPELLYRKQHSKQVLDSPDSNLPPSPGYWPPALRALCHPGCPSRTPQAKHPDDSLISLNRKEAQEEDTRLTSGSPDMEVTEVLTGPAESSPGEAIGRSPGKGPESSSRHRL
ncbi:ankyrin repeat domain 55 [Platysternon megacephalum]|uniref:Ankyrin repeat domain 55 n=1 Tax=Platysternon megacephalum TaxID=55544 RepID=A0A4D9ECU3_9SAUR|nr:ankyrin repeat domain 55 [Platysternon megacephalum]